MKNYPNQASSFPRLRETLEAIRALNLEGKDPNDDGVLGYRAAELGIYEFRGLHFRDATREQLQRRLDEELRKPKASQGTRTFARELRRTLRDMGWLDASSRLTEGGEALLDTTPGSLEERALLAEGLLNIEVAEKGTSRTSHPVRILLELLSVAPSSKRAGLELALEARDDSMSEVERVKSLYRLSPPERANRMDVSSFQRDNAVKIFPSLAVTAGLVETDGHGTYSLTDDGRAVLGLTPGAIPDRIRERARNRTTRGRKVSTKSVAQHVPSSAPRMLTEDEQRRAREKLAERTTNHQTLVREFAKLIGDGCGELFEDPYSYDLLWVPTPDPHTTCYLFEMKTINGDAEAQARNALAQLAYYHFFKVAAEWPTHGVVRCAVFDTNVGARLAKFLEQEGIASLALEPQGVVPLNQTGQELVDMLPPNGADR